ncbi:MAG: GYD domain-containing protein [Bacteroidales bacterium]|jgi:uncharacterized protein with GYD domain
MITYITLMKLTDQGVKDLKESPKRIEDGLKVFEKMGGRLIGFYATLGEFDYIGIGEAPNDTVATMFNLALSSLGFVRTTTIKAFTISEFADMIKRLP